MGGEEEETLNMIIGRGGGRGDDKYDTRERGRRRRR